MLVLHAGGLRALLARMAGEPGEEPPVGAPAEHRRSSGSARRSAGHDRGVPLAAVMPPVASRCSRRSAPSARPARSSSRSGMASARIVFRDGDEVEIGSRNTPPNTAHYFPEVVEAARDALRRAAWSTARSSSPGRTGGSSSGRCRRGHPPRRQPRRPAGRGDARAARGLRPAGALATSLNRSPSAASCWSARWPPRGLPSTSPPSRARRRSRASGSCASRAPGSTRIAPRPAI